MRAWRPRGTHRLTVGVVLVLAVGLMSAAIVGAYAANTGGLESTLPEEFLEFASRVAAPVILLVKQARSDDESGAPPREDPVPPTPGRDENASTRRAPEAGPEEGRSDESAPQGEPPVGVGGSTMPPAAPEGVAPRDSPPVPPSPVDEPTEGHEASRRTPPSD